ncbi:pectinesterase family protein [Paenibacillus sp. P25]|nr:pectinesterase family protein [Paenibacillus sp. P25]
MMKGLSKVVICSVLSLGLTGLAPAFAADEAVQPASGWAQADFPAEAQTKYDLVVARDGAGDYSSVQQAIDAVPANRTEPFVIFIKKGVYKEKVVVKPSQANITLIGEDQDGTVITFDDYAGIERPPGHKLSNKEIPTVYVEANDFRASNLTFENSAGTIAQALAMYMNGDRAVFQHVRFLGWQDTPRVEGGGKRSYFRDCYIEGGVDYIYGSGTAVFEQCEVHSKRTGGYITASSAPQESKYGLVFIKCRLTGSDQVEAGTVYLGRPWRDYASVTFIDSTMSDIIRPVGWHNWNNPARELTARYAEYHSKGLGANPEARVSWSRQLTVQESKDYTAEKVLEGQDGWNPKPSLNKWGGPVKLGQDKE